MRRYQVVMPMLAVVLVGMVGIQLVGVQPVAQADTQETHAHPLVGAWLLDLGEEGGRLLTFSADGTGLFSDVDGSTGQGTWMATGDSTAMFTIYQLTAEPLPEGPSFAGYFVITGEIDVNATESWTGNVALAQADRAGVLESVAGPLSISATSIPVEPADRLVIGRSISGLPSAATPKS